MRFDFVIIHAPVSHRSIQCLAMFDPGLQHSQQPARSFEVGRGAEEYHQIAGEPLRGFLVSAHVESGIIPFQEFHVLQRRKQALNFRGAPGAVEDDDGVMGHGGRILVVAFHKPDCVLSVLRPSVGWKDVRDDQFHIESGASDGVLSPASAFSPNTSQEYVKVLLLLIGNSYQPIVPSFVSAFRRLPRTLGNGCSGTKDSIDRQTTIHF